MNYYVYIVKCADDSYYVGITNDLEARIEKHNQSKVGAKYTRSRRPVELIFSETYPTKSEALKREAEIKSWRRAQKQELVDANPIEYSIHHYKNSKHIRITVKPDGSVKVTAPKRASKKAINDFVQEKAEWIKTQQDKYAEIRPQQVDDKKSYKTYKEAALRLVNRRLEHFNKHYGFEYTSVRITNTKSQWGSCSTRKVLSFNYRIAFLAPSLADYLIVHELCHLKEFNHSPRFWSLVEETIPSYKEARKQMRKEGIILY